MDGVMGGMRQRRKVIDNIEDTVMENNFLSPLIHAAIKYMMINSIKYF
jgi:hypothetical protein